MNILNTTELDTQKMVKMVKLLFYVLITHVYTHTHTHTHTHIHTHTKPKGPKILFGNKISDSECFRIGTSLPVQWLELHASRAEGQGSTPGPGTKISNAT